MAESADRPRTRVAGVVFDAPDPRALAAFYHELLGWPVEDNDPSWATLRPPDGGPKMSFQLEPLFVRPTWPATASHQQMMVHLDIQVDDLDAASAHAVAAGATVAEWQPQEGVLVHLDPVGHPFCLFLPGH